MLHDERRPDGVDEEGALHVARVEIAPALFRPELLIVQEACGDDDEADRHFGPFDLSRRRGDALLARHVDRVIAAPRKAENLRVMSGRPQALDDGFADPALGADHDSTSPGGESYRG